MSTQDTEKAAFSVATQPIQPASDFESLTGPTPLFLSGSLMDPEVLAAIARLPEEPHLDDAHLIGYRSKLFGRFPALIPDEQASNPVRGKLWVVESPEQFERVRSYMSSHYRPSRCKIYADGAAATDGLAFVWNEDPESEMLKDGDFDVDEYVRTIKPAVLASGKPLSRKA